MKFTRIFKEIITSIFLISIISFLINLVIDCRLDKAVINAQFSFDSLFQIYSFSVLLIIAILTMRLNLIDNESFTIKGKINNVFDEYGYYGYTLFEEQVQQNTQKFYNLIEERQQEKFNAAKSTLDKEKVVALTNHYEDLKKYRDKHTDSIKPIMLLLAFQIIVLLLISVFKFENYTLLKNYITIFLNLLAIYSIYKTITAVSYLIRNPFTKT
jgi:hypothetical protein